MADDDLSTVWGRFKASELPGVVVVIALLPVAWVLHRAFGAIAATIVYVALVLIVIVA